MRSEIISPVESKYIVCWQTSLCYDTQPLIYLPVGYDDPPDNSYIMSSSTDQYDKETILAHFLLYCDKY